MSWWSACVPRWNVFVSPVPVLVYGFLGLELPPAMGAEMREPRRDVPWSIARAGAATCVLYGIPVLAIVLVLPPESITGLTGFVAAFEQVASVYGAGARAVTAAAALTFVGVLLATALTWLIGTVRSRRSPA